MSAVHLDQFTVAIHVLHPDAPHLDESGADTLQDAHLAFLADLHQQGILFAAGPLAGDERLRGLCILRAAPEQAHLIMQQDPAVRAGRFAIVALQWMVPAGAMQFARTHFPRSVREVTGA